MDRSSLYKLLIAVAVFLFLVWMAKRKETEKNGNTHTNENPNGKHPTDPLPDDQQDNKPDEQSYLSDYEKNRTTKSQLINESFETK